MEAERVTNVLRRPGLRLPHHRSTTRHLASLYPCQIDPGLGTAGVVMGTDLQSGSTFHYDAFDLYARGIITSPNMVILGLVRRGKSTTKPAKNSHAPTASPTSPSATDSKTSPPKPTTAPAPPKSVPDSSPTPKPPSCSTSHPHKPPKPPTSSDYPPEPPTDSPNSAEAKPSGKSVTTSPSSNTTSPTPNDA